MTVGFTALLLLVGGVGHWSVRTEIAGAVIASGVVVVENNRQVVQHPEGGTIGRIAARDGDRVRAGDLLVELDDAFLRSDLAITELQLIELRARQARLEAERDGDEAVNFGHVATDLENPDGRSQIEGQHRLFVARQQTFEQELSQISERILQTGNQITGTEARLVAVKLQADLIRSELEVQRDALNRGLTQSSRVSQLQRELARLEGETGQLVAEIASFKGEIAGFKIERVRLQNKRREGAISELRDIAYRELELSERRSSLLKKLGQLDIRAPAGGVVHGSTIFGPNAVVRPAEILMYVIPQDQPLIVAAKVPAVHGDEVFLGQSATLRFSAFNHRVTPFVTGKVTYLSADVVHDETTGGGFYQIELTPKTEELAQLEGGTLLPGMPVEAFLRTGDRTPWSYLTKPLTDYFERAFREG